MAKKRAKKAAAKKAPARKKAPAKNKGGRPKIQIDYAMAEKLSHIQCTIDEIAQIIGVSRSKLAHDEEFLHRHKKALESGRSSLRRLQWGLAQAGDRTMLIWLGKQYLGQKDKHDHSTEDGPLEVAVTHRVVDPNAGNQS